MTMMMVMMMMSFGADKAAAYSQQQLNGRGSKQNANGPVGSAAGQSARTLYNAAEDSNTIHAMRHPEWDGRFGGVTVTGVSFWGCFS